MPGLCRERAVEADDVHARQQLLQRQVGIPDLRYHAPARIDDAHPEGLGELGNFPADPPRARRLRAFVPRGLVPSMNVGDQSHGVRARMRRSPSLILRRRSSTSAIVDSAVARVRTPGVFVTMYPTLRRRVKVDVVVADRIVRHHPQRGASCVQELGVHHVVGHDEKPVLADAARQHLVTGRRRLGVVQRQLERAAKLGYGLRHDPAGDIDVRHPCILV